MKKLNRSVLNNNSNKGYLTVPSFLFLKYALFVFFRCFGLIESSTLEQTREETETEKMTHLESLVELGLSSTFSTILTQCSKEIFMVRALLQKVTPVFLFSWFFCIECQLLLSLCTLPVILSTQVMILGNILVLIAECLQIDLLSEIILCVCV